MDTIDLLIGPVYFLVIITAAWLVRPYFSDNFTRQYFIPALALKMIAAICLGLLYQFYYGEDGGDTFGYYRGAKLIWGFFVDNPIDAFRIIFWNGESNEDVYRFVARIPHYLDPSAFLVDRIAGFIGLFAFGNYTGISLFFAVISFSGSWALFSLLRHLYPGLTKLLAIAILFIPSVVFWGSGILKDTLTYSAFCWLIWSFANLTMFNRKRILSIIIMTGSFAIILLIKKYILLVLIPAMIIWLYRIQMGKVRNKLVGVLLVPVFLGTMAYSGYQAVVLISESDSKYSLDELTYTVYTTAHDIRYWTGKEAGSGYTLGEIPKTWQDMIPLLPSAINVALFRPYLWEVSNPLMLLLAFESLMFLLFVLYLCYKSKWNIIGFYFQDPYLVFCLVFSLGFAFAVGISTWNFGTLVRYKLPMMPLFASMLVVLYGYSRVNSNLEKIG